MFRDIMRLMITFILPGYSQKNEAWVRKVVEKLKIGGQIRPVFWDHWTDPLKTFNPKEKARILTDIVGSEEKVNIIAKSLGSLVASFMVEHLGSKINLLIYCGIPLNDLYYKDKEIIKKAIQKIPPGKIYVFQNSADPHGSFQEVTTFLGSNIDVIEKEAENHDYPYYSDFENLFKG